MATALLASPSYSVGQPAYSGQWMGGLHYIAVRCSVGLLHGTVHCTEGLHQSWVIAQ